MTLDLTTLNLHLVGPGVGQGRFMVYPGVYQDPGSIGSGFTLGFTRTQDPLGTEMPHPPHPQAHPHATPTHTHTHTMCAMYIVMRWGAHGRAYACTGVCMGLASQQAASEAR